MGEELGERSERLLVLKLDHSLVSKLDHSLVLKLDHSLEHLLVTRMVRKNPLCGAG